MAKSWGAVAKWADDVEDYEEEQKQKEEEQKKYTPPQVQAPIDEEAFPTLGMAATKPGAAATKKVKAKAKPMSLGMFQASSGPNFQDRELRDKEILAQLPTASRGEKGESREAGQLGGAFARDGYGQSDRTYGRREDGDRPPRRGEEDMGPSRADAVSDWGTMRKFSAGEGPSRGFGGGAGGRDREGGFGAPREPREFQSSAADSIDNWGKEKKFEPSSSRGGFEDRPRGGFRDGPRDGPERPPMEPSRADAEDQWSRGRVAESTGPSERRGTRGPSADAPSNADREDRWSRRAAAPGAEQPSSSTPAGERPRLKLAPRTAAAAPTEGSAASDSASAPDSAGTRAAAPAKSSSNPFGAARPREDVLREKGVDPVKEALKLEHGDVKRDESAEEKALKDEIESMRKQMEELSAAGDKDEEASTLKSSLDEKEKELYKLAAELDDAVRFKKQPERAERAEHEPKAAPKEGSNEGAAPAAAPAKARW